MWLKGHTPGIKLFATFVFVLVAVPKANLKIGPLPIYLVDVLVLCLLFSAQKLPPVPKRCRMFAGTVVAILVFALVSEISGMIRFGTLQDSVYVMFRSVLACSVFFLAPKYIRTRQDFEFVLKALVVGLIVTASLMILTSLPGTRGTVSQLIFSRKFLEPAAGQLNSMLLDTPERGIRGRTLVGVSILGATFINICWPFAALLMRWPWVAGGWRKLALLACMLAPMGVLMSYSRGPILGTILIAVLALVLGLRQVKRGMILPMIVGAGIIFFIGIGSQLFYFERLERSFAASLESPYENKRESERSLAYSEPFGHVAKKPSFLFVGEGTTVRYTSAGARSEQASQATHAVFAIAYYSYGMIAAFLYVFLIARALFFTANLALQRRTTMEQLIAQPLFLAMVAIIPWAMLGHAAVSTPRGSMLLFLVIGLVSAIPHFTVPARRHPSTRQAYAYSRNLAFG